MADPSQRSGKDTLRIRLKCRARALGPQGCWMEIAPGFNLHAWWAGSNTRDGGLALNKGI